MSISTPRRSSSGKTVAALPTTPTDSARRSRFAASRLGRPRRPGRRRRCRGSGSATRRSQPGRVDVDDQAGAAVHRDRERLRPAHPAAAGGERERAGERAAEPLLGDRGERLVRALQDALGADVDPGAGGHLAVHRQARASPAGGTPARWPSRRRGWSWRSARAAPTRGCGTRRPAGPTARASSRRRPARSACGRSRGTTASRGRPCRCRRTRRGPPGARPPRGRGCSSACAARPPAASRGRARGAAGGAHRFVHVRCIPS